MTAPLAIVNFRSSSRPVATIKYFSDPRKVVAQYDGLETGVATGTHKELADLLLGYHHDRHAPRVCRTAVISVKTPTGASQSHLAELDRRLLKAAADLQRFLRVASMLGWVHGNTSTRHIHLLFPNSNGRRTLDLRPKFLRQLQGFLWTMQFLAGRGKGRRKAINVYPKSRKLSVRDLAILLLDGNGNIRHDRWEKLVRAGKISNFRRRNNGQIISFQFQGRRIRLATLKSFVSELNQKGTNTMTTIINPDEPLPMDLLDSLRQAGFDEADLVVMLEDMRQARYHLANQGNSVKHASPDAPKPSTPEISL